jgi:hypothetical protein
VKRLALLVLAAVACHGVSTSGGLTGADSPRAAVDRFLSAARAEDMQALSTVWGNTKGPMRDQAERPDLERREMIIIKLLRHDQARIAETKNAPDSKVTMIVELKQGALTAAPMFTLVRGPSSRWYVEDLDLKVLQNAGFGGKR